MDFFSKFSESSIDQVYGVCTFVESWDWNQSCIGLRNTNKFNSRRTPSVRSCVAPSSIFFISLMAVEKCEGHHIIFYSMQTDIEAYYSLLRFCYFIDGYIHVFSFQWGLAIISLVLTNQVPMYTFSLTWHMLAFYDKSVNESCCQTIQHMKIYPLLFTFPCFVHYLCENKQTYEVWRLNKETLLLRI